ncbi:MAG: hypothetical protein F6J98_12055 [Moorea sp. SIO4G2]|nr:hypothetical protein [Moorena sp. SIO4G2]
MESAPTLKIIPLLSNAGFSPCSLFPAPRLPAPRLPKTQNFVPHRIDKCDI